ncbi:MAG: sensor histidine kinase, partial [Rhodospirillaceae bacterium]
DQVGNIFAAEHALLVAEEESTGRRYVWHTQTRASAASDEGTEASSARAASCLFSVPSAAEVWGAVRERPHGTPRGPLIRAIDSSGGRVAANFAIPDEIGDGLRWRSLVALTTVPVAGWSGRVLLVNPAVDVTRERPLRFLQAIARQAGPAIANIYLVRRLRSKVEEVERARMARELHDGVIQSLLGLEIEMDVVRRKAELDASTVPPSIEYLQRLLREQIVAVRKLMVQMKPMRVDGRTLAARLSDLVVRFGSIRGIEASFVSAVTSVDLQPWVCAELVRIAEEGMVNVRKHSGATRATVTLDAAGGYWRLAIEDNGRGFGFSGRVSQAEMEAQGIGPAVIMERVQSIGGQLWLETDPGTGSRLEVLIPQRARG